MEIANIEKIERVKGTAYTLKADLHFLNQYCTGVEKFLRDNQSSLGDNWVREAGEKLYSAFKGKNKEGDLLGSSTNTGVAIATFTDIPLITGQQMFNLYNQAGDRNPFEDVYIDLGIQINGNPVVNPVQAKILLDELKRRGVDAKEGRVLDFRQLKLIAHPNAGLAYELAENIGGVMPVSAYPFGNFVGKHGLFRACLGRLGGWLAGSDDLADSDGYGRGVRYDAEGVALQETEKDLGSKITEDFRKKF
jgi:hypothetical protein